MPPYPVTVYPNSGALGSVTRKQTDQRSVGIGPAPDMLGWLFRMCTDRLRTLPAVPPVTAYGVPECGVTVIPVWPTSVWPRSGVRVNSELPVQDRRRPGRTLPGRSGYPCISGLVPCPPPAVASTKLVGPGLHHTVLDVRVFPSHHRSSLLLLIAFFTLQRPLFVCSPLPPRKENSESQAPNCSGEGEPTTTQTLVL